MATTISNQNQKVQTEKVSYRRLAWVAPLAMFGAAILNVIVQVIASAAGAIRADHPVLGILPVFLASFVQVGIGAAVFAIFGKTTRRPIFTFRIVAIVALVLSLTQPFMVASGVMPIPGTTSADFGASTVATMIVMHLVAGIFTIWVLTTQAREDAA
jgi:hypothetical protein